MQADGEEVEEEEEEQEDVILALPAPGDQAGGEEGEVEADMHAAIASAELADYAKVLLLDAYQLKMCSQSVLSMQQLNINCPYLDAQKKPASQDTTWATHI